ncbi:hypothetical protein LguiB_010187 [Lonicera macranthoides]
MKNRFVHFVVRIFSSGQEKPISLCFQQGSGWFNAVSVVLIHHRPAGGGPPLRRLVWQERAGHTLVVCIMVWSFSVVIEYLWLSLVAHQVQPHADPSWWGMRRWWYKKRWNGGGGMAGGQDGGQCGKGEMAVSNGELMYCG